MPVEREHRQAEHVRALAFEHPHHALVGEAREIPDLTGESCFVENGVQDAQAHRNLAGEVVVGQLGPGSVGKEGSHGDRHQ
jgi:hypothetical protein